MEINKDDIFIFAWTTVSDKLLDEIIDTLQLVGKEAAENAEKTGILPGRNFKTKGYVEINGRWFKITLNFRGLPFKIRRMQVDEIGKREHDNGIEAEKNNPRNTTYWI